MRRRFAFLALALLIAAPAGAQQKGRIEVPKPTAQGAALRGTFGPAEAREGAAPAAPSPPPATPLAGAEPPPNGNQCRLACAQRYYVCLTTDESDVCGPAWGQCRLSCGGDFTPMVSGRYPG